jgi:hypothetical protein
MSWVITGSQKEPPSPYLIDTFAGAAAAYSLRQLRTGNTNVVRVRRSSDNTESDFTAAQVSDGSLATFCGAGNGFVRTWYDQSGNGRNAGNPVTGEQPQIVSSGSLVTEGGKPAVQFDGSNDSLDADTLASVFTGTNKPMHALTVLKSSIANAVNITAWAIAASENLQNGLRLIGQSSGTNNLRFDERNDALTLTSLTGGTITARSLAYAQSTTSSSILRMNGAQVATGSALSGATPLARFSIGCLSRSTKILFWNGTLQEIVFYPVNMTASQANLESNINAHYAIY